MSRSTAVSQSDSAVSRVAADTLWQTWSCHLAERSPPLFGQIVTWLLLFTGLVMTVQSFDMSAGPRNPAPSTVISWLPTEILSAHWPFYLFRAMFLVGGAAWGLNRGLRWSCWLAVAGFTGLWGMHLENTWAGAHIFHAANNLLIVQALWTTLYHREITAAWRTSAYWQTPLYPRWVFLLSLAYLGLFHTYAGLAKIVFSGWGWANGTSLQLWTHMEGFRWSPTTQLLLNSKLAAYWLQVFTLITETGAILALPFAKLRVPFGLMLLGFYAGVILTFPYGFEFNMLFTALFFLPVESWLRNGRLSLR